MMWIEAGKQDSVALPQCRSDSGPRVKALVSGLGSCVLVVCCVLVGGVLESIVLSLPLFGRPPGPYDYSVD